MAREDLRGKIVSNKSRFERANPFQVFRKFSGCLL